MNPLRRGDPNEGQSFVPNHDQRLGGLQKSAANRAKPVTTTDCHPYYWLRPPPKPEPPHAQASHRVWTVPIRRDYGVVPMGVGPHGNHTGV